MGFCRKCPPSETHIEIPLLLGGVEPLHNYLCHFVRVRAETLLRASSHEELSYAENE